LGFFFSLLREDLDFADVLFVGVVFSECGWSFGMWGSECMVSCKVCRKVVQGIVHSALCVHQGRGECLFEGNIKEQSKRWPTNVQPSTDMETERCNLPCASVMMCLFIASVEF
jgi:hypothetical protein